MKTRRQLSGQKRKEKSSENMQAWRRSDEREREDRRDRNMTDRWGGGEIYEYVC